MTHATCFQRVLLRTHPPSCACAQELGKAEDAELLLPGVGSCITSPDGAPAFTGLRDSSGGQKEAVLWACSGKKWWPQSRARLGLEPRKMEARQTLTIAGDTRTVLSLSVTPAALHATREDILLLTCLCIGFMAVQLLCDIQQVASR